MTEEIFRALLNTEAAHRMIGKASATFEADAIQDAKRHHLLCVEAITAALTAAEARGAQRERERCIEIVRQLETTTDDAGEQYLRALAVQP
jgi:hypothetical protein